jgi:Rrf2 family cysteine metabolism transcriptional repressor
VAELKAKQAFELARVFLVVEQAPNLVRFEASDWRLIPPGGTTITDAPRTVCVSALCDWRSQQRGWTFEGAPGAGSPRTRRAAVARLRPLAAWARLNPDVITRNSPEIEELVAGATPTAVAKAKQPRSRSIFPGSGAVHFSTRGEYGVRMMVELARHHGAGPISLAEMADHEALPRPYLEQLVVSLREAGLVHSTRGAHGGYELTRQPVEIRMGEVVRALEGPIAPMVCASEDPTHAAMCDRTGYCSVNHLWMTVQRAISAALDSITLADLATPRPAHPFHSMPIPLSQPTTTTEL